MSSALSTAFLSLSSPASNSPPPHCALLFVPAALLPRVCSYLSPKQLLVSVAHTARTTRALLTPACFSSHPLVLDTYELSVLSTFGPPSSLTLTPFHSRVLSCCQLSINLIPWESPQLNVQQMLDSLDHFPACRSLSIRDPRGHRPLTDSELHALLHHPTVLTCDEFTLTGFTRPGAEDVPVGSELPREDARLSRLKRKRDVALSASIRKRPFDWADIHLPHVTRLHLQLSGRVRYTGGAQFLTAHTALMELDMSTVWVSIDELTAVFADPSALPLLARLSLHEVQSLEEAHNISPLVTTLATSVMATSGSVRPVERLILDLATTNDVFGAVTVLQGLTHLHVNGARLGWLQQWETQVVSSAAFPLLQECVVHTMDKDRRLVAADILAFLRCMASAQLQVLDISTSGRVTCDAAAVAQLARCCQLREFSISVLAHRGENMDWRDAALFASFTPGCLSRLHNLSLEGVKLSPDAVIAIASAAPGLVKINLHAVVLSCHPAVVCAIIGGYCEDIEDLTVTDDVWRHVWRDVQAADVVLAYQSAVRAQGRRIEYMPFTQLRHVRVEMCWCTPASVWHALLSLLRHAPKLHCVALLRSNDALAASALANLPSITTLTCESLWPASFATMVEQRCEQTDQYRYVACHKLKRGYGCCCPEGDVFELIDDPKDDDEDVRPIPLQPHSDLFAAYQRSLTADQQAVLARWAAGDFQAGDGLITAADSPVVPWKKDKVRSSAQQRCQPPDIFSSVEVRDHVQGR